MNKTYLKAKILFFSTSGLNLRFKSTFMPSKEATSTICRFISIRAFYSTREKKIYTYIHIYNNIPINKLYITL